MNKITDVIPGENKNSTVKLSKKNTKTSINLKNISTTKGYKTVPKKHKSKAIATKIKQRDISISIDHEFADFAITRDSVYTNLLNKLVESIKKTSSVTLTIADRRRLAHTILLLNLPNKDKKAKKNIKNMNEAKSNNFIVEIANQANKMPTEIVYSFLLKDKAIPKVYVDNFLYNYLAKEFFVNFNDSDKEKLNIIKIYAENAGIKKNKDITFKRILKLKLKLAEDFDVPTSHSKISNNMSIKNTTDKDIIQLEPPKETKYYLDDIDRKFITELIHKEDYIKYNKFDFIRRIKRSLLRKKRIVSQVALSAFVVAIISSTFTFGSSFVYSIAFGISWSFFVTGIITIYRFIKLSNSKKILNTQDLLVDDSTYIADIDRKELKKFVNAYAYVCKHEVADDIFHAFCELERSIEKLDELQQGESIKQRINYEKNKAIYKLRKRSLDTKLAKLLQLNTTITDKLEQQRSFVESKLDKIWQMKFAHLSEIKQQSIFMPALNGKSLSSNKASLLSNNSWLEKTLPFLIGNPHKEEIIHNIFADIATLSDTKVQENKITKIRYQSSKIVKKFLNSMTSSYIVTRFKVMASQATKSLISAKNQFGALLAEIKSPIASVIDWGLIIVFAILGIAVEDINDRINKRRLDRVESGEKLKTGINQRDQTNREELYLFGLKAEKKLSSLSHDMLDFYDKQSELNALLIDNKIEEMDDAQAAEIFIKYAVLKQDLEEKLLNSFTYFYNTVMTKTKFLEGAMRKHDIHTF